jgi:hypothetical protein
MTRCLTMAYMLAALLVSAGCGDDARTDDAAGAVTMQVGTDRDTIPGTDRIKVDFIIHNRSSDPVVVVDCQGHLIRTVERRIDGAWSSTRFPGCPDLSLIEETIEPGTSLVDFEIFGGPGTYRLKLLRRGAEPPFIMSPAIVIR